MAPKTAFFGRTLVRSLLVSRDNSINAAMVAIPSTTNAGNTMSAMSMSTGTGPGSSTGTGTGPGTGTGTGTAAHHLRIAVIGGGITGATAAAQLASRSSSVPVTVTVFDQGRRGPGGRASHRSVDPLTGTVLADDDDHDDHNHDDQAPASSSSTTTTTTTISTTQTETDRYEFDHGCQFFRADCKPMRQLANSWCTAGWAAPWKARFGSLGAATSTGTGSTTDFFGIPSQPDHVYAGVGGMHRLPRQILKNSTAVLRAGTRVSGVRRTADSKQWELLGVSGNAAFHDTQLLGEAAAKQEEIVLGTADAVLFTDISSSFDSWHRASAGVPDSFRQQLLQRPRVPLFSCMVALDEPVRQLLPYDAFTVSDDNDNDDDNNDASTQPPLWFAACSQSKPGFAGAAECWTLISTPAYAVQQIQETTMQDPVTGAFLPQEDGYLNAVPGPALLAAFLKAIQPALQAAGQSTTPQATYVQAQRWGSGLPAPLVGMVEQDLETVCGVRYATKVPNLVYPRAADGTKDYLADDAQGLYYAGDFCSQRCPGFEAAALSGLDVADHMIASLNLN